MAGTMSFMPRIVINDKSGVTAEVRDIVASLECNKIVKNSLGGGSRVELKLKNGKPITILAPLLDVIRGASTTIPSRPGDTRGGEKSAKPSMVLHVNKTDEGNKAFLELLNLLDERAKAICVEKIAELESNKKLQTAEHLDSVYNTWDKKAKARFIERNETANVEDAPLFLRVKIMSRKDSDYQNPANWLVNVKYVDDEGKVRKYEDASELKKGNMKVQAGLEINCVMKSSEGYALDVQLREVLVLESTGGSNAEDETAMAELDPGVAAFLEKKRKLAAEKASTEDAGAVAGAGKVAKVDAGVAKVDADAAKSNDVPNAEAPTKAPTKAAAKPKAAAKRNDFSDSE